MRFIARSRLRHRLRPNPGVGGRRERHHPRTGDGDLTSSLKHVHRLVLAGHSLESALANAALVQPCTEILDIHDLVTRGESIESACLQLRKNLDGTNTRHSHRRDASIALHVLALAASIGGRIAEQLESLIDILSDRAHLRRERYAQAATASASMRLLTWVPLLVGGWMFVEDGNMRAFFLETSVGWMCLVFGLGSNVLGRMWIRREIASC